MGTKDGHKMTDEAVLRFRKWLLENKLTVNKFAKKCGCSRQYLEKVLYKKIKVTAKIREWFKNGGYEYL